VDHPENSSILKPALFYLNVDERAVLATKARLGD
jgi:hypothetical protein